VTGGLCFAVSYSCRQPEGLLGLGICPPQGRYLHRIKQTQNKYKRPYLEWVSNSRPQCLSVRGQFMP
jgi:hypothetical protein